MLQEDFYKHNLDKRWVSAGMKTLGIGTGSSSTTEGAFSHRACRGSCSPAASTCSSSRVQRRRKGEAKMWTYVAVTLLLLECVPSIWSQEFGQQNPMVRLAIM